MNNTLHIDQTEVSESTIGNEAEISRARRSIRSLGEFVTSEQNAVRYIMGQALVDFTYPERSIFTRNQKASY